MAKFGLLPQQEDRETLEKRKQRFGNPSLMVNEDE